jgi:flagellar hook assembly protein FlgD
MPIVLRGSVNGALGLEMNVASLNTNVLQFAGTRSAEGSIMTSNVVDGKVALATAGKFEDGAVIGFLEFNIVSNGEAEIALTNIMVNDEMYADNSTKVVAGAASVGGNMTGYSIEQNAPNPFAVGDNAYTSIGFTLGAQENVTLRVYDVLGNVVRTLADGETFGQGPNSVNWDGRDNTGNIVANGMYYYQITTANFVETVKMQVVR